MAVQPAATIAQLADLFRHVTRTGAPSNNVTVFLNDPRGYIAANSQGSAIVLSDRQVGHLTSGATIANELVRVMVIGAPTRKWLPGAVASTAACRPAYSGPVFAASYSGVGADIIPGDPLAAMLWNWGQPGVQTTQITTFLAYARTQAPVTLRDTIDELLQYILV